jgi:3-hydroxybutyryl-CoA dehydrogenase
VTALHARVPLTIHDPSPSVLSSALSRLDGLLARDVAKNRITKDEGQAARERVRGSQGDGTSGETLNQDVDLIIEVSGVFQLVVVLSKEV